MSDPATLAGARKQVENFAAACGFSQRAVEEIGLCVNEAMANVIRHAYAGRTDRPVHIGARFEGGRIVVTIRDWGNGVDPSKMPERPYDPLEPGGVGLMCLKRWMDEITYVPQPGGGMLTTLIRRRG